MGMGDTGVEVIGRHLFRGSVSMGGVGRSTRHFTACLGLVGLVGLVLLPLSTWFSSGFCVSTLHFAAKPGMNDDESPCTSRVFFLFVCCRSTTLSAIV
jgi:hypothetical protein